MANRICQNSAAVNSIKIGNALFREIVLSFLGHKDSGVEQRTLQRQKHSLILQDYEKLKQYISCIDFLLIYTGTSDCPLLE